MFSDSNKIFRRPVIYITLFYTIVGIILFARCLSNYFLSDDFLLLYYASKKGLAGLFIADNHYFRPVRMVIYKFLYMLFGLNPLPYNTFNLFLHIINSSLVFMLAGLLLKEEVNIKPAVKYIIAALAGFFFLVHYIHSEAVVNISSTSELLYTLLVLLCLIYYMHTNESLSVSGNVLLILVYTTALLTKETSVCLLLILATYERIIKKTSYISIIRKLLMLIITTVIFFIIRWLVTPQMSERFSQPGFANLFSESLKNILFGTVAFFFSLDFMSLKEIYRTAYPDFSAIFSLINSHFPYLIPLIVISAGIFLFGLYKKNRVLTFSVCFIFAAVIPFMWLVGYERYFYLPSTGFVIFIPYLIYLQFYRVSKLSKFTCSVIMFIFLVYNIINLNEKNLNWNTASQISYSITSEMISISPQLPFGSKAYFRNLPDNYKGCWIFREGVPYIPSLILKREDLTFSRLFEEEIKTNIEKKIYVYNYVEQKLILEQ